MLVKLFAAFLETFDRLIPPGLSSRSDTSSSSPTSLIRLFYGRTLLPLAKALTWSADTELGRLAGDLSSFKLALSLCFLSLRL